MSSSWGPIFGTDGGYFPTENNPSSTPTPSAPTSSCCGPAFGNPECPPTTPRPTPAPTPPCNPSYEGWNLYTESGTDETDETKGTSGKVQATADKVLGTGNSNISNSSTTNS